MAKFCVFCGEKLGFFSNDIVCGGIAQPCCEACLDLLSVCTLEERARKALATGRAVDADEIRGWLDRMAEVKARKEAEQEAKVSGKNCLRCGGRLIACGRHTFKLGEETFFFSDINRLMSGSMEMDILRCEDCGKAEFYIP